MDGVPRWKIESCINNIYAGQYEQYLEGDGNVSRKKQGYKKGL